MYLYVGFKTSFAFKTILNSEYIVDNVVFGSVGMDLSRPPGGLFIGMIRDNTESIRPSFLSQISLGNSKSAISSIKLDFLNKQLLLSSNSLLSYRKKIDNTSSGSDSDGSSSCSSSDSNSNIISMVDLRKACNSPVYYYACKIKELAVNGCKVSDYENMYVIIDTGTTGCIISDNYESELVRQVEITIDDDASIPVKLKAVATRNDVLVVTSAIFPWISTAQKKDTLIVVAGLFFLKNINEFIVDIDNEKMQLL